MYKISPEIRMKPTLTPEVEPMTRIELVTSSLPRKRSTPELHRPLFTKI
jgi:hypothetical protein